MAADRAGDTKASHAEVPQEGGRIHRRRRYRWTREVGIGMHLAPMIDVTFLLLIFFLVTTTFERAEGILASEMPRDAGAPTVALPISPVVVRLVQTGGGHDDYSISIDQFDVAPATTAALTDVLRQLQTQPGFDRETPLVIVAESGVRWDHVVGCWNAALRAGYQRIAFAEP